MTTRRKAEAGMGHNAVTKARLLAVIERVERLEEERAEIAGQIREVYAEAKANGYDTKTLRKVVALRKKPIEERQEEEALLDMYLSALGMLTGTPLGDYAEGAEVAS